jgi:hypothetical protein
MATARTARELRRWSDLAAIRHAVAARMPELRNAEVGLMEVAEFCRRQVSACPSRDWNETRDQILAIACEWNLAKDRLEEQSEECLPCLAMFLELPRRSRV